MKRSVGVVGVVAVLLLAVVLWRCHGGGASSSRAATAPAAAEPVERTAADPLRRVDPRTLDRTSIAGTITDEAHAPVAHARVCAEVISHVLSSELTRDPRCTASDDQGHYTLADLYAAEYRVSAMAKPFRPGVFHPDGDHRQNLFAMRAGEHRTDIDIVMLAGGVAITGTVSDISGGPIAHAQVHAGGGWWDESEPTPTVETDEAGKFEMWVAPGRIDVTAYAEGYASNHDGGIAPGKFELLLTPESSIAGTVIDAKTHQPVAGVQVGIGTSDWFDEATTDFTDDRGRFRVNRLEPGRYVAIAKAPNGYGHSAGSTLVGLGQHVDGVVVELHPAYRVTGRVVLPDAKKSTCKLSGLWLHQTQPERYLGANREPDGTLHVEGVLPGKYEVGASCDGYMSRDKYPPIVIADKDALGIEWPVELGATIKGHVVTKTGAPVLGAQVFARTTGGEARDKTGWGGDRTTKDGSYKLEGLKAGKFRVEAVTDQGAPPKDGWKIEVRAGATVEQELVLDDVGSIKGTVVDADGKPVGGVHVSARALETGTEIMFGDNNVRTNDDGSFTLEGLRAGDYRVIAFRDQWWGEGLRKPGSNDDAKQGERATVHAGTSASVRLVVEPQSGSIKGSVVDADGKPVTDAFVVAARESDRAGDERSSIGDTRWSADDKPVLTALDGTFTCTKLSPGNYTLRAFRKGGGEAVAEHVAIGATAKLQMKPTGSIEGTVSRQGGVPDEIDLMLRDPKTDFYRSEHYYKTAGKFAIHDLPQGNFTLSVSAEGGHKEAKFDLGEGEHKTGVGVELDALITLTGRVIDLMSHQPVAGIMMSATAGKDGGGFSISESEDDQSNVSDDTGHFTIKDAPKGPITIMGFAKDYKDSPYTFTRVTRVVDGTDTADVGDISILRRRVNPGDKVGELGLHFVEQPDGTPLDEEMYKISWIDPSGPAAKADIKLGDVITTIDGVDVTGANHATGWTLLRAPPGTKLSLGLARGPTVPIVLAQP